MSGSSKYLQLSIWLRKILRLRCVRNEHSPTWYYYEESVHAAPKQDASALPAAYVTVTLPVSTLPPGLALPLRSAVVSFLHRNDLKYYMWPNIRDKSFV